VLRQRRRVPAPDPPPRVRARPRVDLGQRYGLLETLDRDHFSPSVEAALTAIDEGRT